MPELELSIVLPTYKEKENLEILIPQIEAAFSGLSFEIIVVDDSSKDGTKELLEELNKSFGNIRLIERAGLLGIGSALRDGYNLANGEYILSSDADLSFLPKDMKALYEKIQEGYDMVLGYKVNDKNMNKTERIHQYWLKHFVSWSGNLTVRLISRIPLKNFNTNFRILRQDVWQKIETKESGNFFNFETILKTSRKGFRITEIPVAFYERRFGEPKLRFLRAAPGYFKKLIWHVFFDK